MALLSPRRNSRSCRTPSVRSPRAWSLDPVVGQGPAPSGRPSAATHPGHMALGALLGQEIQPGGLFGEPTRPTRSARGRRRRDRRGSCFWGQQQELVGHRSGRRSCPSPLVSRPKCRNTASRPRLDGRTGRVGSRGLSLADDMGLGKTVQGFALHQLRQGRTLEKKTLAGGQLRTEVSKFVPGAVVRRYHGTARSLENLARRQRTGDHHLPKSPNRGRRVGRGRFGASASWTRPSTPRTQGPAHPLVLHKVPVGRGIALSGTPVENRLTELWSIIDWSVPGLLGTLETFRASGRGAH